ncbi:unnamed protein product [Pieris macdunnoughi]|uniref:Cytochrome P450 n=1 Tax=Pieris macdunnoughi TaxID=345717 RepID=A0A821XFD0_9NEOP|nr:unnamed protein product [Pieris macdunnoughi]
MSALLLVALCAFIAYKFFSRKTVIVYKNTKHGVEKVDLKEAPGPLPLPIMGNLHLLAKNESPFQSFTELAKKYGDIFSMKLGSSQCLIVNNLELIREVLNQNGKFFSGRPDFLRFHQLFDGDRNNSRFSPGKIFANLVRSLKATPAPCHYQEPYRKPYKQ